MRPYKGMVSEELPCMHCLTMKKENLQHCFRLQSKVCSVAPVHIFPPCDATGLEQVRTLAFVPCPQLALQGLRELHSDHPPFIGATVALDSPYNKNIKFNSSIVWKTLLLFHEKGQL